MNISIYIYIYIYIYFDKKRKTENDAIARKCGRIFFSTALFYSVQEK